MVYRKRRRQGLAGPEFHHNVYVVLLSKTALKDPSILRRNPDRDPFKPAGLRWNDRIAGQSWI